MPASALLPETNGLGSALACLNQARFGIAWGAHGCGPRLLRRGAGLRQRAHRVRQADHQQAAHPGPDHRDGHAADPRPAPGMLHLSRIKDEKGSVLPYQVSLAKRNNVSPRRSRSRGPADRSSAATASPPSSQAVRHMLNLESVLHLRGHARGAHADRRSRADRAGRVLAFTSTTGASASPERRMSAPELPAPISFPVRAAPGGR